jgi:hypothetical protein
MTERSGPGNESKGDGPDDALHFLTNVRFVWQSSVLVRLSMTLGVMLCVASVVLNSSFPGISSALVEVGAALALTLPIVLASRLIESHAEGIGHRETRAARRFRIARGRRQRSVAAHIEAFAKNGWQLEDLSRALRLLAGHASQVFFVYPIGAAVVTVVWREGEGDEHPGELLVGGHQIDSDPESFLDAFVGQVERTFSIPTGRLASIDDLLRPLAYAVQQSSDLLADRHVRPTISGLVIWRDARAAGVTAVLLADGHAVLADEEVAIAALNVEALAVSGRFADSGDGAQVVRTACELWASNEEGPPEPDDQTSSKASETSPAPPSA